MKDPAVYTIEDLRQAERDHAYGDAGGHNNPGRTRRNQAASRDRLFEIRKQLIERGIITGDRP